MLFFIPWVILIIAIIVAVPVAAKLSRGAGRANAENGDAEMGESGEGLGEQEDIVVDDFGTDPNDPAAQPIGEDALADFK